MRAAAGLLAGVWLWWGGVAWAAPPAKKNPTPAKGSANSAGTSRSSSSTRKAAAKKKTATAKQAQATRRATQSAPSAERYKQIQQALAEKGYLSAESNGQWGPESIEALKRFQQDQNLEPTGKINALSLIALGLGPEHSRPAAKPEESR
jgi:peptidoglycan hydrolase-like protein with peptidoglycan-binding domain